MVIAELSFVPVVNDSLNKYLDVAIDIIATSGLKFEPIETGAVVWGELEEINFVINKVHKELKDLGVNRILTEIKIDDSCEVSLDENEMYRASF